jgi:hypothetical protein
MIDGRARLTENCRAQRLRKALGHLVEFAAANRCPFMPVSPMRPLQQFGSFVISYCICCCIISEYAMVVQQSEDLSQPIRSRIAECRQLLQCLRTRFEMIGNPQLNRAGQ